MFVQQLSRKERPLKTSQKLLHRLFHILGKINLRSILPKAWHSMSQAAVLESAPLIDNAAFLPGSLPVDSSRARKPVVKKHLRPLARVLRRKTKSTKNVPICWPDQRAEAVAVGQFLSGSYVNLVGTRDYKVYIPSSYCGQALPLVVMLHGCKQNPDDFAVGTRMNLIAEQSECFVVYPAQSSLANKMNCWNWFKKSNQQRDGEEPSLIAGITRQVIATYAIDARRVYIAGLSSGGAMAGIMGATYPDLYAAIGIHSGMPYAGVNGAFSALAAMKTGGGSLVSHFFLPIESASSATAIPAIVFHGDQDATVHPRNGDKVLAQCMLPGSSGHVISMTEQLGQHPEGHAYTRRVQRNPKGGIVAEQWLVHGSGHAWSGGSHHGSYTDPKGPDAAGEMLRFFYLHAQPE
jgi:poly(hydroxyalkanoate) depolymerase family esterase